MRYAFIVALASTALASRGAAQAPDSAVAAPALAIVRGEIPAGKRVVAASARTTRADVVACAPRRPDSCRIVGGDAYIELIGTRVAGDSATATVALWQQQRHPRHPVSRRTYRFHLRRVNGAWTLVGKPEMSTS